MLTDRVDTWVPLVSKKGKERVVVNDHAAVWMRLLDKCLEQQWRDSQRLMVHTDSEQFGVSQGDAAAALGEVRQLGFKMMQRAIALRQEVIDLGMTLSMQDDGNGDALNSNDDDDVEDDEDNGNGDDGNNAFYLVLPSSPDSRSSIHEPLLEKPKKRKKSDASLAKHLSRASNQSNRPHRLAMSPSAPNLSSLLDSSTKEMPSGACTSSFLPACTYNYYPRKEKRASQCRQCYFCKSTMRRQRSLSLDPWQRASIWSTSSSSSSSTSPASSMMSAYSSTLASSLTAQPITSQRVASNIPLQRRSLRASLGDHDHDQDDDDDPTLRDSLTTDELIDQLPLPPGTTSTRSSTSSFTPPPPRRPSQARSFMKSMLSSHIFHKKKTPSPTPSPRRKPSRLLRSLMSRKFTFPHIFKQRKVHPMDAPNASSLF